MTGRASTCPEDTVCILDLFHVMERLWKVAWCFFEEGTQKREAHQWVEERLKRLLEGKVDAVIRGMRYQATQRGLKGQKRKTVRGRGGVFRAEPGSDEVRRILGGGLSDRQWSGRGGVSASGQGSDGADRDALAPVRRAGDAGPTSHLPQRRVGRLLGLPRGRRKINGSMAKYGKLGEVNPVRQLALGFEFDLQLGDVEVLGVAEFPQQDGVHQLGDPLRDLAGVPLLGDLEEDDLGREPGVDRGRAGRRSARRRSAA